MDLSQKFQPVDLSHPRNPADRRAAVRRNALIQFGRICNLAPEGENDPMHSIAVGTTGTGKTTLMLSLIYYWYLNTHRTVFIIEVGKKGESIEFGKLFGAENVIVHIPKWIEPSFAIKSRQRFTLLTYDSALDLLYNLRPGKINIDLGFQAYLDLYSVDRNKKREFRRFVSEFNAVLRERFTDLFPCTIFIEEAKNIIPSKGHNVVAEQMDLSNNLSSFIQQSRGFGFNVAVCSQGMNMINPEARNEFQYKFIFKVKYPGALSDSYLEYFWYKWIRKRLPKHHFFFYMDPDCYFPAACIPRDKIPFAPQPVGLRYYVRPEDIVEEKDVPLKIWEHYAKHKMSVQDISTRMGITYSKARYWVGRGETALEDGLDPVATIREAAGSGTTTPAEVKASA